MLQDKYDEFETPGVSFKEDNDDFAESIKSNASVQPMLVILDDLISSPPLKGIPDLFTVDARHKNISMVFLT